MTTASRCMAALLLILPLACQTAPQARTKRPEPLSIEFEVYFAGPDHRMNDCLRPEMATSYLDLQDGVLFFEKDSKIRIDVPSGSGREPYHAHFFHRVNQELIEFLAVQGGDGTIEIDLTRFGTPETLVVTSAPMKMHAPSHVSAPIIAPYTISFRMAPRDQAEHLSSLQPFRYEWSHAVGKADLFVQSFNRSDMLVTILDRGGNADFLFSNGYFHWREGDGYLAPRAVVEVLGSKGNTLERAATYPVPTQAREAEKPFSFRLAGSELLSFSPPARVDLSLAEERPATTATVNAKFAGVRPKSTHRFILAAGYPLGTPKTVGVRTQSHEVTVEKSEDAYLVDLTDLDSSHFPMTGYLAHRFVEPWRTAGGFYSPCDPLGVSNAAPACGDESKLTMHPSIFVPRYASHYDAVFWFGSARGSNRLQELIDSYWSTGGGAGGANIPTAGNSSAIPWNPSPNLLPPPTAILSPTNPGNGMSNGNGSSGPNLMASTTTANPPFLGWGPPGTCGCGPNGAFCPRPTPCKGTCGIHCPANGHCKTNQSGAILVTFRCMKKADGCKHDDPTTPVNECDCGSEFWHSSDLEKAIRATAVTFCPPGLVVADVAWFGPHGGSSPCHTETEVGDARISYWGPAFSSAQVWYRISVTFEPCKKMGPKGGGGGGGGGKKDPDDEDGPGEKQPVGRVLGGEDPPAKVTKKAKGLDGVPDKNWNPSTSSNVTGRLLELVRSFRQGLGLNGLPSPTQNLFGIPSDILLRTPSQLERGGAAIREWEMCFDSAYWGRSKRERRFESPLLRDVLSDWAVGLRTIGGETSVSGSNEEPVHVPPPTRP